MSVNGKKRRKPLHLEPRVDLSPTEWARELDRALGDLRGRVASRDVVRIVLPNGTRRDFRSFTRPLYAAMIALGWERRVLRMGPHDIARGFVRGATREERARLIYVFRDPITGDVHVGHDLA